MTATASDGQNTGTNTAGLRAPWQPGQSGNPAGRPKGLSRKVRELVGGDGEALAQVFIDVLADPKASSRDRMEAATWLADRGWGKPTQHIDQDVWKREGGPMRADIDPERLEAMFRELTGSNGN